LTTDEADLRLIEGEGGSRDSPSLTRLSGCGKARTSAAGLSSKDNSGARWARKFFGLLGLCILDKGKPVARPGRKAMGRRG